MDVLLKEVLRSLRNEPHNWSFTKFEAINQRTGAVIWTANSWYGLRVTFPGGYRLPEGDNVTTVSSLLGWATWRNRILRACRRIERERWLMDRKEMREAAAAALAA